MHRRNILGVPKPVSDALFLGWIVTQFLYIFGYETPRQRRNNDAHGWDDENSHGVVIEAPDSAAAIRWGEQISQRYVARLHGRPEVDWGAEGYASFIEDDASRLVAQEWPRIKVGEFPDFTDWLRADGAEGHNC